MKKLYLLIVCLFLFLGLQAQVEKTIENTAGQLHTLFSSAELNSITDLTITGTMDARDFRFLRDEMPQLVNLDLRQATIVGYSGPGGTYPTDFGTDQTYPGYTIPFSAFFRYNQDPNNTLQSVQIPLNTLVIGDNAFGNCRALTTLVIPPSVTTIDQAAFYGCSGLTSFTIPPTVSFVGWAAFSECSSLTTMVIPPSITIIREYLFQKCTSLVYVELPATITTIENNAFTGCTSLASINLPMAVTSIGRSAFEGCRSLSTLTFPQGITAIGESAFSGCSSLSGALVIPPGIHHIKKLTFNDCSQLTSLQLPLSLDTIGESAFVDCSALSGPLDLPCTLRTIGARAFVNCSSFTGELILPPLLRSVESSSFEGCRSFNSLVLPESVQSVHAGAFKECSGLTAITVEKDYPIPLDHVAGVFEGIDKSIPLQVPFGSRQFYALAEGWKEFTNIVEKSQGMLLTGTSADFGPEGGSSSSLTLQANVAWTAVSDQPWLTVSPSSGNSTQLLTLTVEANQGIAPRTGRITFSATGLESQIILVSQGAVPTVIHTTTGNFHNALTEEQYNSVTHLTLTGTMNAPEISSLKHMPKLLEVDMSGVNITPFQIRTHREDYYYAANAFPGYQGFYTFDYSLRYDSTLTSIILPSTVVSLGYEAFMNCVNLRSIVFPPFLMTIEDEAFMNCTSLTAVQLPPSVKNLGYGVFSGCTRLREVQLSEGITALNSTFAQCISLRNITLPSSLKTLGSETFKNCTELAHIELPPLLMSIGGDTFAGCTALSTVNVPSSVTSIGYGAFKGCSGLKTVTLPRSLTYIGISAFQDCRNLDAVYSFAVEPPQSEPESYGLVFWYDDFEHCTLYVPFGSKALYEQAPQWNEFKNIVEMDEFRVSVSSLDLTAGQSTATVDITSSIPWTAISDQGWLSVTPSSGTGNTTVTLTSEANTTVSIRMAKVTLMAGDQPSQDITVRQTGLPAASELTPGSLSSAFSLAELRGMTRLTITGTMDARDFKTIRDQMSALTALDLSAATIAAYSGPDGTVSSHYMEGGLLIDTLHYPANGIPSSAFYATGSNSLISSIVLPASLTSIGNNAFSGLTLLEELAIPSSVTTIGVGAFSKCSSLTALVLPPTLTHLSANLIAVSGVNSINIPAPVTSIGYWAFGNCPHLSSIYSYAPYPPENIVGRYDQRVIVGNNTSSITLYVPYGSAYAYRSSPDEWHTFASIVEMPGFRLSALTVALKAGQGSSARVGIKSDVQWTASSDQSWLTVSPSSGTGTDSLLFTAEANSMETGRMATVTISAPEVATQTIRVIQEGTPRTVHLTPGSLSNLFTPTELRSVTNLTLTGVMDVRDFRIMRDRMPLLTVLDMSRVTISEFQETDRLTGKPIVYRVNQIPDSAFFDSRSLRGKASLTKVVFPLTLEKIGYRAFSHASGLSVLRIPTTVGFIEPNAFNSCQYLDSVFSYALAPPDAHESGTGFYNVDNTRCTLYVPLGSGTLYAQSEHWKAFTHIVEMADFKIMTTKATLKATRDMVPVKIQSDVVWSAEPNEAWLTVNPASGNDDRLVTITAEANPLEMLRTGTITFKAEGYLPQIFTISQEGLPKTISLTAGNLATQLTAEELNRVTSLVITGTMDARDFKVIRDQMPWLSALDLTGATITGYAGTEGTYYGDYYYGPDAIPPLATGFQGTQQGNRLASVILPASIYSINQEAFAYSHTLSSIVIPPSVNYIGQEAFRSCSSLKEVMIPPSITTIAQGMFMGCTSLTTVSLPSTLTSIDDYAFQNCDSLKEMVIPSSVVYIGEATFYGCRSLTSIVLPTSITSLEESLFQYCTSLTSITIPTSVTSMGRFAFFSCSQLTSVTLPPMLTILEEGIFIECTKLRSLIIPPKVTSIGSREFINCTDLVSVTIPESVNTIDGEAFWGCTNLTSLYVYRKDPPRLRGQFNVFDNVNYSKCTLYVPKGSRSLYVKADQWKEFKNIVEMGGFELSVTELSMEAGPAVQSVNITTQGTWSAVCDKDWLSVTPSSGEGQKEITLTVQANDNLSDRVATVTFSAPGAESKTITVTQRGLVTGLDEITSLMEIKSYPNPFTSEMTIEIANPSLREVSAEIFNMSGQKIRTLVKAQKGAIINLIWNGANEQGHMMPFGLYLLKVNEQTRKVVFGN